MAIVLTNIVDTDAALDTGIKLSILLVANSGRIHEFPLPDPNGRKACSGDELIFDRFFSGAHLAPATQALPNAKTSTMLLGVYLSIVGESYFPIQNVEKIRVSMSSVVVSPVISPRKRIALCNPTKTISSLCFWSSNSIDWSISNFARVSRS